jgi:hypothetical protein
VSWSEGITNAPAELVTKAKQMADTGVPAVFGKTDTKGPDFTWVIVTFDADKCCYKLIRVNG